jgi:hypothetical protein
MSEFWQTLILGAVIAGIGWALGFWMGWEKGRAKR